MISAQMESHMQDYVWFIDIQRDLKQYASSYMIQGWGVIITDKLLINLGNVPSHSQTAHT